MKTMILILVLAVAGCDGGPTNETGVDGGATNDGGSPTVKLDGGDLYTPQGVRAELGTNPCVAKYGSGQDIAECGWDPSTGAMYERMVSFAVPNNTPGYLCLSLVDECALIATMLTTPATTKTYAPGTVLVWRTDDSKYLAGPNVGHPLSFICVPNKIPVTITESSIVGGFAPAASYCRGQH